MPGHTAKLSARETEKSVGVTDIEEEIMNAYLVSITGLKDSDLFLQRYVRAGVATMSEESVVALRK